ncbi:MAG: hypothetical protein N3A66_11195, partial [Planctomycetota bacterium]|nr:hypothetical protein [Planctomycetota bacterium]
AIVCDDDLVNDREPALLWQQDCIELFVDCRRLEQFLKPPYSAGACQIFVRPPLAGKEPLIAVNPRDGDLPGLKVAGKAVAGGYSVEIFIPWAAFPDFKPVAGASVGLQFAIDDYDQRDGAMSQPLMMSWQGATALFNSPQKLMRWTLVENLEWRADAPLAAHWAIDVATSIAEGDAAAIAFWGAQAWPAAVKALKARVLNWRGEVVQEGEIALQPSDPPWAPAPQGAWRWSFRDQPDGVYAVEIAVEGEAGCLGKAQRHVMLVAGAMAGAQRTVAEAIAAMEKADLPALAKREPFCAKAWLGLAANAEKVKWAAEIRDLHLLRAATAELATRLALLTTGALPPEASSLSRLLILASQPEAQIAVEYPCRRNLPPEAPQCAAVNFYCGSLPLASCAVWELSLIHI